MHRCCVVHNCSSIHRVVENSLLYHSFSFHNDILNYFWPVEKLNYESLHCYISAIVESFDLSKKHWVSSISPFEETNSSSSGLLTVVRQSLTLRKKNWSRKPYFSLDNRSLCFCSKNEILLIGTYSRFLFWMTSVTLNFSVLCPSIVSRTKERNTTPRLQNWLEQFNDFQDYWPKFCWFVQAVRRNLREIFSQERQTIF